MAIQNPRNLYAGNAGIFSSTPYTNFAINQLAQKQAKNDAVDKYYESQFAKINGAGLAPSEQEALLGTKNNMMNYYMQNKDAIHKGDIPATTGINQYLSKMQDIIGRGKYKTGQAKEVQTILKNPNSSSRLTDTARQGIDSSSADIYSKGTDGEYNLNTYDPTSNPKGYKPFDFDQHLFNEQPYTSAQMQTLSDKYSKSVKPDNITYNPIKLPDGTMSKTQIQSVPSYSDAAQKQIIADKENAYKQDDKLAYTVDKGQPFAQLKDEHESDFNLLNSIYKKTTGKDITDGAGLYAASELARMTTPQAISKPIINQDAKTAQAQGFSMKKMYTQNSLIEGRQDHAHALKEQGTTNTQDAWQAIQDKSDELNTAQKNGYNISIDGKPGIKDPIQLDNGKKMYGIPFNSIGNASSQGAILKILKAQNIKSDGSDIFLQPNSDGSKVSVVRTSDGLPLTTISQQQVQLAANPSVKGVQKVLSNTSTSKPEKSTAATKVITHSRSEYKTAGWTDAQINKALKAGKIKVK